MRSAPISLCALLLALAGTAQAQIFRCEGPNGVVEYTNAPPAGPQAGRTCKAPAAGGGNGGAAAGTAPKPAASPDGFPKVDPATQRTRDSDRRRILEDELKKEETRLAAIQKEYNNGEPERQGDERNYQKYLDRVQRLKEDIQRTEGNLATIRRELSALK